MFKRLRKKVENVEENLQDVEATLNADDDTELGIDDEGLDTREGDDWLGDGGGDYGESMPAMEKHTELLKSLMDFSPYLKTKFEKWVNIIWDEQKEMYVTNDYGKQIMNKVGSHWCISFIDTYARDNNMITHIGEEDYNFFKEDLIYSIWPNVYNRYEEFGIVETGDCNRICIEVLHTALLVLMGSGDGKAAKILTDTTHRTESLSYAGHPGQHGMQGMQGGMPMMQPPQKSRGFFAKLKKAISG